MMPIMETSGIKTEQDVQAVREFLARLPQPSTVVDFEEIIQLATVRSTARTWSERDMMVGFACVDDYGNLWFEANAEGSLLEKVESETIEYGTACMRERNREAGTDKTLDWCCGADDSHRRGLLEAHGFRLQDERTLHFSLPLDGAVREYGLPEGFRIRPILGQEEVEALVALYQAAFGTEQMTVEWRQAIMNAPQYRPDMDLVAVAPGGELAGYCICGFSNAEQGIGYTDPIGVHPRYQKRGLGRALVSEGLVRLREAGAKTAEVGTSSGNIAMRKLAQAAGFVCVEEKLWYSREAGAAGK